MCFAPWYSCTLRSLVQVLRHPSLVFREDAGRREEDCFAVRAALAASCATHLLVIVAIVPVFPSLVDAFHDAVLARF